MERWKCSVCGDIYDPVVGNADKGVVPGTPFEQLPEDWTCPVCGQPKSVFERE
ncbi:MAG: rubredoxin [Endomicrobium sp.]|jgi:rubredoxin|nr:rubredoxin [Endomicrobium sp.]